MFVQRRNVSSILSEKTKFYSIVLAICITIAIVTTIAIVVPRALNSDSATTTESTTSGSGKLSIIPMYTSSFRWILAD